MTLHNFGPYLGEQRIQLSVDPSAPIVIFYGENLFGKTTLLNAIRWCLYEEALDRRGDRLPISELVNYEAADARNWVTGVTLEFSHQEQIYILDRQAQAEAGEPLDDGDFRIVTQLRVDGQYKAHQDIKGTIDSVLHRDISDFFLFDGEMLGRYEELLHDDARAASVIRDSIEQILGLPALSLMRADFGELEAAATKRHRQALEAQRKDASTARKAEEATAERDAIRRNLDDLRDLLNTELGERERLRLQLQRYAEVQADAEQIADLESEGRELEARRLAASIDRRKTVSANWWIPIISTAAERVRRAQGDLIAASEVGAAGARREVEIAQLESAIADGSCPTCGEKIESTGLTHIHERLRSYGSTAVSMPTATQMASLGALVDALAKVADSGPAEALLTSDHEFRRLGIELRRRRRKAEQLRQRLREHDVEAISSLQHSYDAVVERASAVAAQISQDEKRLTDKESELRQLQGQLRHQPGANPRIGAEARTYTVLADVFGRAMDGFRNRMRIQVEAEASEIFRQLIAAPDLTSLSINEQFGLRIQTDTGRELTTRSAGAEQIVALSLIGALNHCAVREGPIVMDTPLGRLDRRHRRRILEYLPKLGPQVILLVQSGEFERDRDLAHLGATVGLEYELDRPEGRSTRTEVRKLD
jgi:DNA sulfur modification protein DndD